MADDGEDGIELVNPALFDEYLRGLQAGLDAAEARDARLTARIAKLEHERALLRERLAAARQLPAGRKALLRALLARVPAADPSTAEPSTDAAGDRTHEAGVGGDATAVLPVVGTIGPVAWPVPAPVSGLRIGLVADEFTTTALRFEADVVPLRADDGPEVLRRERPDLLFVESAYNGDGGTWRRRIARFGDPHEDLVRLVDAARELGIPTAFWNKEDPINTDWFTASVPLFDHVFTVDLDMLPEYRRRLGHDRVHGLPFAAQPAIHTPPSSPADRVGPILFAGTWFAIKHPERRVQMEALLDPARPRGLHVLDRHAGGDGRFGWPDRFREHIVGSLPYPLAVEATRRYRVVVNVNTVTDSPTMCARRVFELAACATPTVSGPSRAIRELVPAGAIAVVSTAAEAAEAYDRLLGDPAHAAAMGAVARDWVLSEHTWAHRVAAIAAATGLT